MAGLSDTDHNFIASLGNLQSILEENDQPQGSNLSIPLQKKPTRNLSVNQIGLNDNVKPAAGNEIRRAASERRLDLGKRYFQVKSKTVQLDFAVKKAIIIIQSNYNLTRELNNPGSSLCQDIYTAKQDKVVATSIAHGFGVHDKDITHMSNWTTKAIDEQLQRITEEFDALSNKGQRTFLYVYCLGNGCIDSKLRRLFLLLNGTASNMYPIEQNVRNITSASKLSTVFAMYDLSQHDRFKFTGFKLDSWPDERTGITPIWTNVVSPMTTQRDEKSESNDSSFVEDYQEIRDDMVDLFDHSEQYWHIESNPETHASQTQQSVFVKSVLEKLLT